MRQRIYEIVPAELNKQNKKFVFTLLDKELQQLLANGFESYFCKKNNLGEIDFLVEMGGKVVSIEVKSGKSYKSLKALENYMEVPDYHIDSAYVLSAYNVGKDGRVIYLPIWIF